MGLKSLRVRPTRPLRNTAGTESIKPSCAYYSQQLPRTVLQYELLYSFSGTNSQYEKGRDLATTLTSPLIRWIPYALREP